MNNGNFTGRVVVGAFLVLLGLGLFLDQLGLRNILGFNIFRLWPLILIAFGITLLVRRSYTAAMFMLLFGVAFLLSNVFNFSIFAVIWPVIIIFIGFSILFKPSKNFNWTSGNSSTVNRDALNESVIFWGLDEVVKSDNFRGGKVDAVFGGFKLDLREVKIAKDGAYLEVNGVFGGGEILLPKDIRVQIDGTGVMGAFVNKVTSAGKPEDPLLRIKGAAVFGGVEVKN